MHPAPPKLGKASKEKVLLPKVQGRMIHSKKQQINAFPIIPYVLLSAVLHRNLRNLSVMKRKPI